MKKLFSIAALLATVFVQQSFAQDSTTQSQFFSLLQSYYGIKDALVAGSAKTASAKAEEFLKSANGISHRNLSEGNRDAFLKDAGAISETNDLKKQREYFSNLSSNMVALAKSVKLSTEPIYLVYCPMKRANWLSKDKTIQNPYYGSAMLTCGSITETIGQ
jgi:hypothetical protein